MAGGALHRAGANAPAAVERLGYHHRQRSGLLRLDIGRVGGAPAGRGGRSLGHRAFRKCGVCRAARGAALAGSTLAGGLAAQLGLAPPGRAARAALCGPCSPEAGGGSEQAAAVFVLVARLGVRALAVSNIVRSLYTFASLPALALAAALQTIVSRYVGQGRQAAVLPTVRRAALLAVGLGLGPVLVLVAVPLQVAGGFSDEPALVAATRPLLQLLAALLLTFSASTMWSHAVVGVGGADRSLGMELGATSAYLLAAWGAVRLGWPLAAVWATELGYWALLGGLSWRYLRRGQWQILQ
ncbi:MATE family efflux transporter [Hymenobacter humi]|uniref:MATE family efflux transporter n=1 Tax=Hymenobacter humi TaxID=1411620 RepID=A0ABW2U665_9BACT